MVERYSPAQLWSSRGQKYIHETHYDSAIKERDEAQKERKKADKFLGMASDKITILEDRVKELEALLNTPELKDFIKAVPLEAAHQRERWGVEHDAGKEPEDWFWLLGYLAGKALAAFKIGDKEKALHHTISSAAVLANWHAAILGKNNEMRPGIAGEKTNG